MILVIRSNVLLEFNVFETYLRLIAWHHIYSNAQSCQIRYTLHIFFDYNAILRKII